MYSIMHACLLWQQGLVLPVLFCCNPAAVMPTSMKPWILMHLPTAGDLRTNLLGQQSQLKNIGKLLSTIQSGLAASS
jgi:hypothetical protein